MPAKALAERATPDAFRVAGPIDKTGYFRVGRDVWHPGHDIGLRLSWQAPTHRHLNLLIGLAQINARAKGLATYAVFINGSRIMVGSSEPVGFSWCARTLAVEPDDRVDVIFGYEGVIDNLECLYRARLTDDDGQEFDPRHYDPDEAIRLAALSAKLNDMISRELDARSAVLGQAGYFRYRPVV